MTVLLFVGVCFVIGIVASPFLYVWTYKTTRRLLEKKP
jgi:hypothetical protein